MDARRWIALAAGLMAAGCVDVPAPAPVDGIDAGLPSDGRPPEPPASAGPCAACPAETICVDGACVECEPGSHRGCAADSTRPICDPQTLTCVRCSGDACGGQYCLPTGRCAECDPIANRGCGEPDRPICDVLGRCRTCALDVECVAAGRPPICDADTGVCRLCVDDGDRGCDPGGQSPICEDGACRGCGSTPECGEGRLCIDARCVGCNPVDNSGCDPAGPDPICFGGACVPCARDSQCLDPQRGVCVDGRCQACDPGTHAGCDPEGGRPLCLDGACVPCGEAGGACGTSDDARPICLPDGRCAACDPADGNGCRPNGAAPVCDADTLTCVGCSARRDCRPGYCDPTAGGRCVPCVAGTATGCDPQSDAPTCLADTWQCGACRDEADCAGNARGPECNRDGTCGCSDDDQCDGNPVGIHCHGAGDCGCHDDDDCLDGYRCDDTDHCVPR